MQASVHWDHIGEVVTPLLFELHNWLFQQEIEISGSPLLRYWVVDYETGQMDIHVGIPIAHAQLPDHPRIKLHEIPAGDYATLMHEGDYAHLKASTVQLFDWGKTHEIRWQNTKVAQTVKWAGRFEHCLRHPQNEPRPENWRTEIAILIDAH
jgi:DNA gyrase inhibitor GyrI